MWFKLNDGNKAKPCTPQTQSRRAKRGEGFPPWSSGSKLENRKESLGILGAWGSCETLTLGKVQDLNPEPL